MSPCLFIAVAATTPQAPSRNSAGWFSSTRPLLSALTVVWSTPGGRSDLWGKDHRHGALKESSGIRIAGCELERVSLCGLFPALYPLVPVWFHLRFPLVVPLPLSFSIGQGGRTRKMPAGSAYLCCPAAVKSASKPRGQVRLREVRDINWPVWRLK